MREFVTKLFWRAPIIKPLRDEFERMLAARDAAFAERDVALAARDAVLIERDTALAARDAALIARYAALAARDALIERDPMALDIQKIRNTLTEQGDHSHTSIKFQDSLIQFIRNNLEWGGSVIEVGCYRGGLTTQLAWTCREFDKQLFVVDVSADHVDIAKANVHRLVPGNTTAWFVGDLPSFMNEHGEYITKPIVVFVDGDHTYSGVVKDIKAILARSNAPHAVIFHDFSLRYRFLGNDYADVRVDLAIFDCLGHDIRLTPIGEIPESGRTEDDGPHFEIGLPEGVIVLYSDIAASLKFGLSGFRP